MTETPTGRLAWGQAGTYDAIDDRAVIRAVTGGRNGLTAPVSVSAGAGLAVIIGGGWLGVADCGDGTSAVVGTRLESVVQANPGPPTGTRTDLVWCDLEPDEGTWALVVITEAEAAGRPGIALATLVVPANATLASQMDIRPADVNLDRRLIAHAENTETNVRTGNSWATVGTCVTTATAYPQGVTSYPGRWYRMRFTANSPAASTANPTPPTGRIGIGLRAVGAPDSGSAFWRASAIVWPALNLALAGEVERVYRHSGPPVTRHIDGRIWIIGSGGVRTCAIINEGPGLVITVEDLGT